VRSEVLTAVTIEISIFWDVTPCTLFTDVKDERTFSTFRVDD
jgi:hypothetical protein